MIFVIPWLFFSVLVGILANSNDRSGCGFFLLSLLISPLVTAIIVLIIGNKSPTGSDPASSSSADGAVKCSSCGTVNSTPATYCSSCGDELTVS